MTCENCARLQAQLDLLKKELTFRGLDMRIAAVMVRIGCTPAEARTLLALYDHRGVMEVEHLAHSGKVSELSVKVHVMRLRDTLGETAIITARRGGYSLSVPTHSMVMAALEPVELAQEVKI